MLSKKGTRGRSLCEFLLNGTKELFMDMGKMGALKVKGAVVATQDAA